MQYVMHAEELTTVNIKTTLLCLILLQDKSETYYSAFWMLRFLQKVVLYAYLCFC